MCVCVSFVQTCLRHIDISLYCQFLALNDSINNLKMNMSDGYSEYTGSERTCSEYSECSFDIGSRTSSLSSLSEDGDWISQLNSSSLNSTYDNAAEHKMKDDVFSTSASVLLQQINALAAEAVSE